MSLMYYTIMSLVQHLVILLLPQSGRAAGRRVSECAPSAEVMDAATQDPDLLVGGGGEGGEGSFLSHFDIDPDGVRWLRDGTTEGIRVCLMNAN